MPAKLNLLGVTLAAHFVSVAVGSILFASAPSNYAAIFFATLAPLGVVIFRQHGRLYLGTMVAVLILFFGTFCIGYFLNPLSADPIGRVLIITLVFALGWLLAVLRADSALSGALVLAGIASAATAAWVLNREGLSSYLTEGARLGGEESHPNFIGLTAVCIALCGSLLSSAILKFLVGLFAVSICLVVQSRNSLLAIGLLLAVVTFRDVKQNFGWGGIAVFLLLAGIAGVAASDVLTDLVTKAFLLDDPYRGSGTDLVGRSHLWRATWNLFVDFPFFGFGLGQHQAGANIDMYAHNMYLIILSETGLIGFITFVVGTCAALLGLFRGSDQEGPKSLALRRMLGACIAIYYVYGVFEGRAINAGNFLSVLFFLALGFGMARFVVGHSILKRDKDLGIVERPLLVPAGAASSAVALGTQSSGQGRQ